MFLRDFAHKLNTYIFSCSLFSCILYAGFACYYACFKVLLVRAYNFERLRFSELRSWENNVELRLILKSITVLYNVSDIFQIFTRFGKLPDFRDCSSLFTCFCSCTAVCITNSKPFFDND